jgi:DNA-binding NarL/FixJ family response regulator
MPPQAVADRSHTNLQALLGLSRLPSHEWQERSARMPVEGSLRVIIADGDAFARRLIKGALRDVGMTVVAEAGDGREAVELGLHYRPDVVVMEIVMPVLDGILATRKILEVNSDQRVVVLTGASEEEFGLPALRAGAAGFLSKEIEIDALPQALLAVRDGEAAISNAMTRRLIERFREGPNGASGLRPIKGPLTAREWEVIELVKPGHSTDHVADTLVLSPETVRSHIKSIMRKLGVHSRADAVVAADRLRIAPPDGVS